MIKTFYKQPREILDFDFLFADYLTSRSDSLASATVTAEPGITLDSAFVIDASFVKVFVSSGVTGQKYLVTCLATTVGGRVLEAEFYIGVKEINRTVQQSWNL